MDKFTLEEFVQIEYALQDCIDRSKQAIVSYELGISLGPVDDEDFLMKCVDWHKKQVRILESALMKIYSIGVLNE